MELVCIRNKDYIGELTINSIYYDITDTNKSQSPFHTDCYFLVNDVSNTRWYMKSRFKLLSDIREEKISKLL